MVLLDEKHAKRTALTVLGSQYVGMFAQSRLLTEISRNGNKQFQKPQKITGYEIVETFGEPTLMVIIGGNSVYEKTLFNIYNSRTK